MTIPKEKLSDLKEKFEQALSLVEDTNVDSLEPYKQHYKARDLLYDLENILESELKAFNDDEDKLTLTAILSYVRKDIGRINLFVEETGQAEIYFNKALETLGDDNQKNPKTILSFLDTLNQQGILWSKLQDMEKSKSCLVKSEETCNEFKELSIEPLTIFDVFGTEVEKGKGAEALEKTSTLTYFYLAQVYGTLGEMEESAKYCHETLKRQLEVKDYESIEWSLNAATLSQYYFGKNRLKQSRHLLAASTFMLNQHAEELEKKELTADQREAALENLRHRTADVDLCHAKYLIYVIKTSIERLLQEQEESQQTTDSPRFKIEDKYEKFPLNLELYERDLADSFVLTFDDAKLVFLAAQSYLNKAKEYYNLANEASQYARIIQDYATLYKHLAFFEDDTATQAKLQKRRIDQLEAVQAELNPTYYMNICRELMFELGLAYSDILDIKLERLKYEDVQPQALSKINKLCHKAIENFQEFVNSYRDKKTSAIPTTLDVDDFQAIACAYFNLGRLFYKLITPDKKMQLDNTTQSYNNYKIFIDYCETHKEIAERMKGEKSVTQSMVELLPHKMKKLKDEIMQ